MSMYIGVIACLIPMQLIGICGSPKSFHCKVLCSFKFVEDDATIAQRMMWKFGFDAA
jgi:hypothetical protein